MRSIVDYHIMNEIKLFEGLNNLGYFQELCNLNMYNLTKDNILVVGFTASIGATYQKITCKRFEFDIDHSDNIIIKTDSTYMKIAKIKKVIINNGNLLIKIAPIVENAPNDEIKIQLRKITVKDRDLLYDNRF